VFPAVLVSFEEPQYTFNENDGSVTIVVVKSGDTDTPITIRVAGGEGACQEDTTLHLLE